MLFKIFVGRLGGEEKDFEGQFGARLRKTQYRHLYHQEALVDDCAWLQGGLYVTENKV